MKVVTGIRIKAATNLAENGATVEQMNKIHYTRPSVETPTLPRLEMWKLFGIR